MVYSNKQLIQYGQRPVQIEKNSKNGVLTIVNKKPQNDRNKVVAKAIIVVQITKNNTIITLTDLFGNTKSWASSGSCGYKGGNKSSPVVTKYVAEKVAKEAMARGLNRVQVQMRGIQKPKKFSAISGLIQEGISITKIQDITALPHNGCRAKKLRRK